MNACEFATIEEAFGMKTLKSPEPPILRGHVAEVHEKRHRAMDSTIRETHAAAQGYPGSPSCFGNAQAGPERESERCPAGTSCSACARRHTCPRRAKRYHGDVSQDVRMFWASLSRPEKLDLWWLALHDAMTSDIVLFAAMGIILYLLVVQR